MKPLTILRELIFEDSKRTHPNVSDHCRPINTFDDMKPEKREKNRIQKFCQLKGHAVYIIENRGQRKDNRKVVTDYLGFKKTIGSVEWIGSGMKKGIADLMGGINGKSVSIEVKRKYKKGKDKQSKEQIKIQQQVEADGGVYVIVESFDHFYEWYNTFVNES